MYILRTFTLCTVDFYVEIDYKCRINFCNFFFRDVRVFLIFFNVLADSSTLNYNMNSQRAHTTISKLRISNIFASHSSTNHSILMQTNQTYIHISS